MATYCNQELIMRRKEYRTLKLSPKQRFDALTCCIFTKVIQASSNSSHVTFQTRFLLGTTAL